MKKLVGKPWVGIMQHLLKLSIFTLLIGFMTGCAQLQTSGSDQASVLKSRAAAYWKARLEGDLIASYEYEELNARKQQTLQQYAKSAPPLFLRADIVGVELLDAETGRVDLVTEFRIAGLLSKAPIKGTMGDIWILINGQWFHKYVSALPKSD